MIFVNMLFIKVSITLQTHFTNSFNKVTTEQSKSIQGDHFASFFYIITWNRKGKFNVAANLIIEALIRETRW